MLLLFRFLLTMIKARFRSPIGPLDESVVRFTALPHDCDLNFHLNAGRYVSFMDVARLELIGRMRLFGEMLRRGWRPVMGGAVMRYRRSVMPFQRFDIRSRVIGWDEKWIYIEHIVEVGGKFCAVGHMRTVIRAKDGDGNVPPSEVLALMGQQLASPPLPEFVANWRNAEEGR
ncbi:MAG TPA: thioesterase family protein [Thermoanaerobaculia bacterium]|nr:thioesterase family protein [Thermoanaerobaculia bacterium]